MRLTLLLGLAAFLLPAASATETPSRPLGLCTAEPIELQQQARRAKKSKFALKMEDLLEKFMMPIATVLAVALAVLLFMYLPVQLYT